MVTLHPPKKRAKRNKFVEYNIDDVNHFIYNDLNNPMFKELEVTWPIEKLLMEGEKAAKLNTSSGYHYATSYGRVFNMKQVKQLVLQNVRDSFHRVFLDAGGHRLEEIMESVGFIYDFDTIQEFYNKHNFTTRWLKG